jgi:hypothetical protein
MAQTELLYQKKLEHKHLKVKRTEQEARAKFQQVHTRGDGLALALPATMQPSLRPPGIRQRPWSADVKPSRHAGES